MDKGINNRLTTTNIKECHQCSKVFETVRGLHTYCSRDCKDKARIRLMAHKEPKAKKYNICQYCGEPKRENYSKTCSKECTNERRKVTRYERNKKIQKLFEEWKIKQGCSICEYNKCGKALDFHHLYNKQFRISARDWWSYKNYNSKRVENELKKCILVCKNCHMELQWGVSNP